MKTILYFAALLLIAQCEASARPPNIIFVLADDLGWAELGCYGNGFNETPNLDQLAGEGMRFTQAYAAAPVCSPYRAALLTGQYPARVGIVDYLRPNSASALSTAHVTLAEAFQSAGYKTGMIGKWHLTGYKHHGAEHEIKPVDHGFDWDFAREVKGVGNGANFWPYVFRDQPIPWIDIKENRLGDSEYLVDRMNAEAVDFIQQNRDQPFFLYLSHYATHTILNGKPDLVEKFRHKHAPGKSSRDRCYLCQDNGQPGDSLHHWAADHNPHLAAMLASIDDGIGLITAKVEQLGLSNDTIIIFTSDNGGETNVTRNGHLRGGKSQLYEGGIRVPLIVRWAGRVPAESVCQQPTMNVDFYPTLLEAARVESEKQQSLDGVSTFNTWLDPSVVPDREAFYWHYPLDQPHFLGGRSAGAIREGDWKLIEYFDSGESELYQLDDDPSEQNNLASQEADQAERLRAKLKSWRQSIAARTPSPPLLTSPTRLYFADSFSPRQVSGRWFFQKEWNVHDGVLLRNDVPGQNKRIFVKDPTFQDAIIKFDFQFRGAGELRLLTGASGHYNTVLHIHPDHFFIQTAKDDSGPYFNRRHGECAYEFQRDRWYTMTLEFSGNRAVAHLDQRHIVSAEHPIIDKERTYLAIQVDQPSAAFDNLQLFTAKSKSADSRAQGIKLIEAARGRHPVTRSLEESLKIRETSGHDILYQTDDHYRQLVHRVDELKARERELFPEVFRTHKEFQKGIANQRKHLLQNDPQYKETLFTTYRAARAIESFLLRQDPSVDSLPKSQRAAALEHLRIRFLDDARYRELVAAQASAQEFLEAAYPELFVTNEEFTQSRNEARKKLKDDATFKELIKQTAEAHRAQKDYLHERCWR